MNIGDSQTVGSELRALPASKLVDGAQIVIDEEIVRPDLVQIVELQTRPESVCD